ncbi:hypothetical protein NPIL_107521 [Nephila pilipes]|uniref:Uncharacterized protein n=1 Tax=Nephila pilipes TaxID=299642 RepID=A0A8X6PUA3_NEPPI|nr:hypothetical protein NPIL_107521 [Nephila pilipes]
MLRRLYKLRKVGLKGILGRRGLSVLLPENEYGQRRMSEADSGQQSFSDSSKFAILSSKCFQGIALRIMAHNGFENMAYRLYMTSKKHKDAESHFRNPLENTTPLKK